MKLSPRLSKVYEMLPRAECIADIGTDHAYIPIHLIEENKANRVIACDIHCGPAERALQNIEKYGFSDRIEVRVGSGLGPLKKGEADGIIAAGMGGLMIIDVLKENPEKSHALQWMVLQPQNHAGDLRIWLAENGYRIVQEDLALESVQLYEMMMAVPGYMSPITALEAETGILEKIKENKLFKEKLYNLIGKRDFMLQSISEDSPVPKNRDKREQAAKEKAQLEEILWKLQEKL